MNYANRTPLLLVFLLCGVSFYSNAYDYTNYCAGISFRETPYADMYCAKELSQTDAKKSKHFQLDYDDQGRLAELRYMFNNQVVDYSDRFVRSPHIKFSYQNNKEIRQFYDQFGARTLVSGDVYEAHFTLDKNNNRAALNFYGLDGELIDNDFGIARYNWLTKDNGDVIEKRYNTNNELVSNRPGFGYQITRFSFNASGLLTRMYNLGLKGEELTPDDAGVAMTSISYNRHGQFTGWVNLNKANEVIRGMSNIAEIAYQPSQFASEQIARFIDEKGQPQTTNWGAHMVSYEFDPYGNQVDRKHFDTTQTPVGSSSGIHQIKSAWSPKGITKVSDAYYDSTGAKIASSYSGVHTVQTTVDELERPVKTIYLDLSLEPIVHKGMGYAMEVREYTPEGYLKTIRFKDTDEKLVNHSTWQVASFEYEYSENGELLKAVTRNAKGKEVNPMWNPAH